MSRCDRTDAPAKPHIRQHLPRGCIACQAIFSESRNLHPLFQSQRLVTHNCPLPFVLPQERMFLREIPINNVVHLPRNLELDYVLADRQSLRGTAFKAFTLQKLSVLVLFPRLQIQRVFPPGVKRHREKAVMLRQANLAADELSVDVRKPLDCFAPAYSCQIRFSCCSSALQACAVSGSRTWRFSWADW